LINKGGFYRGHNMDLLMGLKGETPESFIASFGKIVALAPDKITIYQLRPELNYVEKYFAGDMELFKSECRRMALMTVGAVAEIADSHGYAYTKIGPEFDSWNFEAPWMREGSKLSTDFIDEKNDFYSDLPIQPFSVFGIGSGARSHIFGELSYMTTETMPPRFDPDAPDYSAKKINAEFEMAKFVLLSLDRKTVCPYSDFLTIFNADMKQKYVVEFRMLERLRIIKVHDDHVRLISNSNKDIITCGLILLAAHTGSKGT